MQIKNVSSSIVSIYDLVDSTGRKGITLNPGQEILVYDEDAERSGALIDFMKRGLIQKIGDIEPKEDQNVEIEQVDKVIRWINSRDKAIQFANPINGSIQNEFNGTHGTPVNIAIVVTDGDGTVSIFNHSAIVVVTVDAGTINGVSGSVTVNFTNGQVVVSINRADAGDVNISLSGGNTNLDKSDTAVVYFA